MKRAEMDGLYEVDHKVGTAEPIDDDHSPHSFLYLPDLSSPTRWAAHSVPTKEPERERKQMGFRR